MMVCMLLTFLSYGTSLETTYRWNVVQCAVYLYKISFQKHFKLSYIKTFAPTSCAASSCTMAILITVQREQHAVVISNILRMLFKIIVHIDFLRWNFRSSEKHEIEGTDIKDIYITQISKTKASDGWTRKNLSQQLKIQSKITSHHLFPLRLHLKKNEEKIQWRHAFASACLSNTFQPYHHHHLEGVQAHPWPTIKKKIPIVNQQVYWEMYRDTVL